MPSGFPTTNACMPRSIRATRAPGIGNLMKLGKHSLGSKGCIRVLCMQSLCQRTGYYVTCSHFGKGLSIVCAVSMAEGWTLCMQSVWKRVRYCKCSHFDRGLDTVYAVSLAQGVCNQFRRGLDTVYADSLAEGWMLCMESVWQRAGYCVCSQFVRGLDAV